MRFYNMKREIIRIRSILAQFSYIQARYQNFRSSIQLYTIIKRYKNQLAHQSRHRLKHGSVEEG